MGAAESKESKDADAEEAFAALRSATAGDLLAKEPALLLKFSGATSVESCLAQLAKFNYAGAPFYQDEEYKYVDTLDIAAFLLSHMQKKKKHDAHHHHHSKKGGSKHHRHSGDGKPGEGDGKERGGAEHPAIATAAHVVTAAVAGHALRERSTSPHEGESMPVGEKRKGKHHSAPIKGDSKHLHHGHHLHDSKEADKHAACVGVISDKLLATPIARVGTFTLREPVFAVDQHMSLDMVVQKIHGLQVHRLLVTNHGEIMGIVTQSRIIRWILNHSAILGPKRDAKIEDLKLGFTKVVSLPPDAHVYDAIQLMYDKRIGSVGVEAGGILLNSFGHNHLKGITKERIHELTMTLEEFDRASPVHAARHGTVSADTTFLRCLEVMVDDGLHRAYVIDSTGKCVGVIALSDIIREIRKTTRRLAKAK